jgi:hypothetical protein
MAFNDTYRESIQTKHIGNVGFTSTAKGVTNEAYALVNPHQVLASQIPAVDVVGTYGALTADGISAGVVEEHIVKLTADPTVNGNKAWIATENNCTTAGHSSRGSIRLNQWMRVAETQYKLRLYEDTGSNAPDYTSEILPSEVAFNWEYDPSAGVVYFDDDPSSNGKTTPLWGVFYTYVGDMVEDSLGSTASGVGDLTAFFEDTDEPTGFVNRTSSTLTFDDATRTVTLSGAEFSYYIEGEKYTKSGAQTRQIPDTEGMHYIYYTDGGSLTSSTTWSYNIIQNYAFVTGIYWDAANNTGIYVSDERHGITMDGQTHAYLHAAFGTQYIDGLALTGIQSNDTGASNDHARFGYAEGNIRDEDILFAIDADDDPAQIPVFYKDGGSGYWRMLAANDYPIADNHSGATLPKWNEWTGATWQLTEVSSDGYIILSHIFATNDINHPIVAIAGQAEYSNVADAREGANNEINNLVLTGMPFAEFVPIGTVIYMCSSSYGNTPKARIIKDADGNDYVDWRYSGITPTPQSVADHANLTGRDKVDSHPASAISADVTTFSGSLSSADDTVQKALETLDDHTHTESEITDLDKYTQSEVDNLISTTSGTLQDDIIWEITDTPYDQIRPKAAHINKAVYLGDNLTIVGDLTVSGTTTTVHSEELTVADKTITVNAGEAGAGITGDPHAGIEVDRGSEVNYMFVFDETQDNFRVGISGSLQAVATREDSPSDGYVAVWNDSATRFDTALGIALDDLATDAELNTVSGVLQSEIDAVSTDLANNYYTITQLDAGQLDNRYYTETEVDNLISGVNSDIATTSGTLQTQITSNDNDISTLQSDLTTASGYLQDQIDASNEFLELTDTPSSYTANDMMYMTSSGVEKTSVLTFNPSSEALDFSTSNDGTFGLSTTDGSNTSSLYGYSDNVGINQSTASGYSNYFDQNIDGDESVNSEIRSEAGVFTEDYVSSRIGSSVDVDDGPIAWIRSEAGWASPDSARLNVEEDNATFWVGTGTYPGAGHVAVLKIEEGGITLENGTTVNEISTTVDSGSTDDQLATAKSIYDYVEAKPTTFLGLTDTPSSFNEDRIYFAGASGVIDDADLTYDPDTDTLTTTHIAVDSIYALDGTTNTYAAVEGHAGANVYNGVYGSVNSEVGVAGSVAAYGVTGHADVGDTSLTLLAGVQAVIDSTSSGTVTQAHGVYSNATGGTAVTTGGFFGALGDATTTYGVYATAAGSATNRAIYGSASGGTTNYAGYFGSGNVYITNNLEVDGTFELATGTTVNEISTVVSSASTDDQLPTAKAVYDQVNTISGSLQDDVIWEVVDTPSDQIRPKVAHQGKAIYSAGNLTIGGDLTVSGTTTTVHSQELTVADKVITVNAGEAGAGITGSQYAGIEVDRGSETDYYFVFDEVQDNFRVGISGSLQAVATREDSPSDGYVAVWNDSATRFDTSLGIALDDLATDAEVDTISGTLQSQIDQNASDISSHNHSHNSLTGLQGGTTAEYYHLTSNEYSQFSAADANTFTFGAGTALSVAGTFGLATGTTVNEILDSTGSLTAASTDNQIATAKLIYNELEGLVAASGTLSHDLLVNLDYDSSGHTGFARLVHTHVEDDITDLGNYSVVGHSHVEADITDLDKYTQAEVDALVAAQNEFTELTDTISSYNAGRVLFTTASGVVDDADFTFDSGTDTLSTTALSLGTGGSVNEVVTTVTSGTTDSQIPTAKAVWDLTEAAAAAVHTHYDVDATWVSNTSWTYGTGFAAVPDDMIIFVNGVKQRIGATYDVTAAVPGGVLTLTFTYNVYASDWVSINYTATD